MPTTAQIIMGLVALAMLVASVGILVHIVRRGLLLERTFAGSPRRQGVLSLGDVIVTVGLWLCAQMAAGLFVQKLGLAPGDRGDMTADEMLLMALAGQATMGVAVVFVLVRAHMAVRGGLAGFGLGLRQFAVGVKAGVVGFCAIMPLAIGTSVVVGLLMKAFGREPPQIAHDLLRLIADSPWGPTRVGLVVSAVVIAPALEEVLFRGMIQTGLQQSGLVTRRWPAIALTSVVFAAVHLGMTPPEAMPTLFVLSLGLGYVYEKSGSLWSNIGVHTLFNAAQITLALNLPPDATV